MKLTDYIKGKVRYDDYGTQIWDEDEHMIADIRGWGSIQYLFKTKDEAMKFQDRIGEFIAEAINEKLNQLKQ